MRLPTPLAAAVPALALIAVLQAQAATTGIEIDTQAANGAVERISATLHRPDGDGRFPAVVMLHDCSGLGPRSGGAPRRWADELERRGYVVVLPDSFGARGHANGVCTNPDRSRDDVRPARRVRDAYAALEYLRSLPYVDAARIGVMGGSHGGSTTLLAVSAKTWGARMPHRFAAAVALYPGCAGPYGDWRATREKGEITGYSGTYRSTAPLLVLSGEADDWTPAEPCRRLAASARAAGDDVTFIAYPGAHHAFDSDRPVRYVAARVNASSPTGRGATTGGNPRAWAESIREVTAFFAHHLGR